MQQEFDRIRFNLDFNISVILTSERLEGHVSGASTPSRKGVYVPQPTIGYLGKCKRNVNEHNTQVRSHRTSIFHRTFPERECASFYESRVRKCIMGPSIPRGTF